MLRIDNTKMIDAFNAFAQAAKELSGCWDDYKGELTFSRLFPFHQSFDAVSSDIDLWTADAVKNLQIEMNRKKEMTNRRMQEKLENSEALDISNCPKNNEGDYILASFTENVDYCDAEKECWIWSIGRNPATGEILASTTSKFYQHEQLQCLFLR